MKSQSLISLILMSSLATLVSCGGGKQSEAKFEISKSFVTNGEDVGSGGLLIHGAGPNNQTFTFALDKNSLEKKVTLDNGLWSFYAVAWDGNTKFSGSTQCAMAKQDISANVTIDLTIKAENCNEAFNNDVVIHELKTLTCGSFKTYNSTENKYIDLTVGTPDNFCAFLPMGQQSELPFYKLVALESSQGKMIPSTLESGCLAATTETGNVSIINQFPMRKFPVAIKAYRSQEDCQYNRKHQIFHFPHGIHPGDPENFDHLVFQSGTAPIQTRLILPSSITKRGTSLFENLLPQFLCGTLGNFSDCFKEPTIDFHVYLNWGGDSREHLLEKNTGMPESAAHLCSAISDNKKFEIKNCRVDDGNLYGQVVRREHLYCQDGYINIRDIYSIGNHVYALSTVWNDLEGKEFSKIVKYNELGEQIGFEEFNTPFEQLAVDQSTGIKYASFGTQVFNLSTNITYEASDVIKDIQIAGPYLFVSIGYGTLEAFSLADGTKRSSVNVSSYEIRKLKVHNETIYLLPIYPYELQKVAFNPGTGVISNTPENVFNPGATIESFTIEPDGKILLSMNSAIHRITDAGLIENSYTKPTSISNMEMLGSKVLSIYYGSNINLHELSGNEAIIANPYTGYCDDTILVGSKSLKILTTAQSQHMMSYTDLVRTLGLRNIVNKEHPYYLFDTLQSDHDETQEGGGYLSDIQSDLSSTGIFSLIRTHKSCEELAQAAKVSPVRTKAIVNHYIEGKTYELDFEVTSSTKPLPFCLVAGPDCTSDIKVKVAIGRENRVDEKLVADLKCNATAGTYEAYYFDEEDEEDHELLVWNVQDMSTAQFEYYSLSSQGPDKAYREMVKAKKTSANNFWLRHVNYHESYSVGAQVSEIEGNGTDILHTSIGAMSDNDAWENLFTNTTITGEAYSCFPKDNQDLFITNKYCHFSGQGDTQSSRGVELSVEALSAPGFINIFSLQK